MAQLERICQYQATLRIESVILASEDVFSSKRNNMKLISGHFNGVQMISTRLTYCILHGHFSARAPKSPWCVWTTGAFLAVDRRYERVNCCIINLILIEHCVNIFVLCLFEDISYYDIM